MEVGLIHYFAGQAFDNFLRAARKLERLSVGVIRLQEHLDALAGNIPWMKTRDFEFVLDLNFLPRGAERILLESFKDNFRLDSVEAMREAIRWEHGELFDDEKNLAFYLDRNKRVDEWIEKPRTVSQKVWPEALHLADPSGPESLFMCFSALCRVLVELACRRASESESVPSIISQFRGSFSEIMPILGAATPSGCRI